MPTSSDSVLALDVGDRRIGVACANVIARIAQPLTTIINDDTVLPQLQQIISDQQATIMVIGLPRGLDGQHTAQTRTVEAFKEKLQRHIDLPLYWQDEALTSRKAETELQKRGKPYSKGDIDAYAASYILEDFLHDNPEIGT